MTVVDQTVDLFVFAHVNHQDALDGISPAAAFQKQRNGKNHVGRLDALELLEHLALDHGMQDRFELFLCTRIREHDFAHQVAFHALCADHVGAEGHCNFGEGFSAGAREFAADFISVNHRYP